MTTIDPLARPAAATDVVPSLPAGYTTRPLRMADSRGVFEVMAAAELADLGEILIEEADLLADWGRPSSDLATSTVGVLTEDGTVVAYAELTGADRADVAVHPEHRGRGIGTWLAFWLRELARSRGSAIIGNPVPVGSPGDALLAGLGYRVRWTSWALALPEGAQVPDRPLPPGYAVRAAVEAEYPACWTVLEDAFLEWSVRDREPYEDFLASVTGRPGFEPWNVRVVTAPTGEVVAVAILQMAGEGETREGYIARLATRSDLRGRGLAQALLVDAFAVAREHGALRSTLGTDSRTGALGLYEKVGMVVTSTWVNRAIDL